MAKVTKQDDDYVSRMHDKSNQGSDEHDESAADQDVGDYYAQLSKRRTPNYDTMNNGQIKQAPQNMSPADGGDGYVGSNTGPSLGMDVVSGKKGYSINKPLWETQSSMMGVEDNTGSSDGDAKGIQGQQDDTDEYASYKRIQSDEGLPQTYRDSQGAGDAGPEGSDEPDANGMFGKMSRGPNNGNYETQLNTQSIPAPEVGDHEYSDMPQTEFTDVEGGGAPKFKHKG